MLFYLLMMLVLYYYMNHASYYCHCHDTILLMMTYLSYFYSKDSVCLLLGVHPCTSESTRGTAISLKYWLSTLSLSIANGGEQ